MRLPTMARPSLTLFTMMAVGGMLLTACAGDATAPRANPKVASQARTSPFVPTDAQKALIGIGDGTYSLKFDPNTDQQFTLGANHLALPAHSVCKLDGSGYTTQMCDADIGVTCDPKTYQCTGPCDQRSYHGRRDGSSPDGFLPGDAVQPGDERLALHLCPGWHGRLCQELGDEVLQ